MNVNYEQDAYNAIPEKYRKELSVLLRVFFEIECNRPHDTHNLVWCRNTGYPIGIIPKKSDNSHENILNMLIKEQSEWTSRLISYTLYDDYSPRYSNLDLNILYRIGEVFPCIS